MKLKLSKAELKRLAEIALMLDDIWPWSAEQHADAMKREAADEAARKAALAEKQT